MDVLKVALLNQWAQLARPSSPDPAHERVLQKQKKREQKDVVRFHLLIRGAIIASFFLSCTLTWTGGPPFRGTTLLLASDA